MMKLEINELDLLQLLLQCKFEGVEQALDMMKALADEEDRESVLDYEKTASLLSGMGFRVMIGGDGKHRLEVDF